MRKYRSHKEIAVLKNQKPPLCRCGCKRQVKWHKQKKCWNKYINSGDSRKGKESPRKGKLLVPREIRECACRCGATFECRIMEKRRFKQGHNLRINNPMDNLKSRRKSGRSLRKFYREHPEAHKLQSERIKEISNRPEVKKKNKEYHNRPEVIAKLIERNKNLYKTHPNARKKQSKAQKKHYREHPERAKQQSKLMKKYFREHPEIAEKHSKYMKKYFKEHPEAIEQMSKRMKKFHKEHPEIAKQNSRRMKKYFREHPEIAKRLGKYMKKYYQEHPEALEKISGKNAPNWKGGIPKNYYCKTLADCYITDKLRRDSILEPIDIPPELIKLKREQLKLYRLIKKKGA